MSVALVLLTASAVPTYAQGTLAVAADLQTQCAAQREAALRGGRPERELATVAAAAAVGDRAAAVRSRAIWTADPPLSAYALFRICLADARLAQLARGFGQSRQETDAEARAAAEAVDTARTASIAAEDAQRKAQQRATMTTAIDRLLETLGNEGGGGNAANGGGTTSAFKPETPRLAVGSQDPCVDTQPIAGIPMVQYTNICTHDLAIVVSTPIASDPSLRSWNLMTLTSPSGPTHHMGRSPTHAFQQTYRLEAICHNGMFSLRPGAPPATYSTTFGLTDVQCKPYLDPVIRGTGK